MDGVELEFEEDTMEEETDTFEDTATEVVAIRSLEEKYELGRIIGRGGYSCVRVAIERATGQICAMKIIPKGLISVAPRLKEEIKILLRVRHRNIISLIRAGETENELFLHMELAEGGELFERIGAKDHYSEKEAAEVTHHLLAAVEYLHSNNIIHRDIKPENILLKSKTNDTDVKLSDFGFAKLFAEEEEEYEDEDDAGNDDGGDQDYSSYSHAYSGSSSATPTRAGMGLGGGNRRPRTFTSCGTDYYVAPEVLCNKGYDSQVDLWSIGVVMYILLCGFPPFYDDENDINRIYSKIRTGDFSFPDPYFTDISSDAKDLISHLLVVDPESRFTANQALQHPWIRGRRSSLMELPPLCIERNENFKTFVSSVRTGRMSMDLADDL